MSGSPEMLDSVPEVLNNDLIRQIKSMEVDLYKRMSELSKKYGEQHPQMIAIESELKTLQKRKGQEITRVINSLRNEYKVAEAREKSLKAALEKQKRESLDLNQKAIQYTCSREGEAPGRCDLSSRFKRPHRGHAHRKRRIIDRAGVPRPRSAKKMFSILLASSAWLPAPARLFSIPG
jgi:hypothetical protein